MAKTRTARAKGPNTDQKFDSFTLALDGKFDKNLNDLPETLRLRVEQEFFPITWDVLSAEQRRCVALQLDYKKDPATELDRQYWREFYIRQDEIKAQITEWKSAATPTASDIELRELRLGELQQQLDIMELQERRAREDYYPEHKTPDTSTKTTAPADFIAYPKAMRILREKWQATPEELAVWIFLGPESDGIAAYLNANELSPPPPFSYAYSPISEDYLSPLMMCWFREDDLDRFSPSERYITGKQLLERWGKIPDIQAEAFIIAKIAESRLVDLHPIAGGTRITFAEQQDFPPLESGLFAMSHIEQIETEDFDSAPFVKYFGVADPKTKAPDDKGGRPQSILTEAIEMAYLYYLELGDISILKPGQVRAFLKSFRSLVNGKARDRDNWETCEYIVERIEDVKISSGKYVVIAQERQDKKTIRSSETFDQKAISRILNRLRKKYPLSE
jgi:hypothetical protein